MIFLNRGLTFPLNNTRRSFQRISPSRDFIGDVYSGFEEESPVKGLRRRKRDGVTRKIEVRDNWVTELAGARGQVAL